MKTTLLMGVILSALTALSQENAVYHVVAGGDTAAAICRKYQISTNELLVSNPGLNLARLRVGQRLRVLNTTNAANLTNKSTNSIVAQSITKVTTNDTVYFERIKKAILANDIEWLSGAIAYPLVLRRSTGNILLRNSNDLRKHSASILTPNVKSQVRNQLPASLFKNWQGVMIGDGVIWFSQVQEKPGEDWKYRIIAVNPEAPSALKGLDK